MQGASPDRSSRRNWLARYLPREGGLTTRTPSGGGGYVQLAEQGFVRYTILTQAAVAEILESIKEISNRPSKVPGEKFNTYIPDGQTAHRPEVHKEVRRKAQKAQETGKGQRAGDKDICRDRFPLGVQTSTDETKRNTCTATIRYILKKQCLHLKWNLETIRRSCQCTNYKTASPVLTIPLPEGAQGRI